MMPQLNESLNKVVTKGIMDKGITNDAASELPPSKKLKSIPDQDVPAEAIVSSSNVAVTECDHLQQDQEYVQLPPELRIVDFTKRVSWRKFQPYSDIPAPIIPIDTKPIYDVESSPALCHHINAISGRARACTIHVRQQSSTAVPNRPITTPIFMPVGTKGCLKALTFQELTSDPALQCPIILANTYHLAIQPGTELINDMGGLHKFQGLPNLFHTINSSSGNPTTPRNSDTNGKVLPYNLLTDSGGFQMVSLVNLSEVTEDGVAFENPYNQQHWLQRQGHKGDTDSSAGPKDMLLLRPEDSIRHQNKIGANIIMALDDVISSVSANDERFQIATYRTLRWYDRCYNAHAKKQTQNLFPILQGGIDASMGGLREQCLAGFRHREETLRYITPGYAIGGLAGGEEKSHFWKVVDQCCRALPDDKPRYLMGVGYPLDLVVCTALGVDMFDCVYPTRTARFGVALISGKAPGTLRLKGNDCLMDMNTVQMDCKCQPCRRNISRATLARLFKAGNPVAVELLTQHNIAYMMQLVRDMREAILVDQFPDYVKRFINLQYPGIQQGGEEIPRWVVDALNAAGIDVTEHS